VAEPVDDGASAARDQRGKLGEDARAILRVKTIGPVLGIGDHLFRGKAHDRPDVLAHERAGEIAGGLGRVDDGGTDGEQVLKALPFHTERRFRRVGSGAARSNTTLLASQFDDVCDARRRLSVLLAQIPSSSLAGLRRI
jgi:hypothetical protein